MGQASHTTHPRKIYFSSAPPPLFLRWSYMILCPWQAPLGRHPFLLGHGSLQVCHSSMATTPAIYCKASTRAALHGEKKPPKHWASNGQIHLTISIPISNSLNPKTSLHGLANRPEHPPTTIKSFKVLSKTTK